MSSTYQPTLRNRIIARRDRPVALIPLEIPLTGIIAPHVVDAIQQLAFAARGGDIPARDALHSAFERRLARMGLVVRPWPNTAGSTGIWDREDANQEGWLVFVELLAAWDGTVPFVKYLFARYPWRLRDRVLRGIGKPLPPMGEVRIHEENLATSLFASDDEQPESALMAAGLLEEIINQRLGCAHGTLTALRSPDPQVNRHTLDAEPPFPQVKEA